jgi:CubicO group peptidase (beta-lactamase class C family)
MLGVKGGPAGGGYSTVEDLTRFADALNRGKLLDMKHVDVVLTGKVPTGRRPSEKYGYGFFESSLPDARIVGHGGGFFGVDSKLDIYLGSGYTVAVMSNYDPPASRRIAEKARALITQK